MAIEKKLIHFGKLADFEAQLTAGNILDRSIVFIQDAKKIWTHGTYYDCSEGTAEGDELWYVDDTNGKLITDYDTEVLAELQAIRVRTNSISAYNGNEYATGEQGQVLTADGNGNMQWSDLPENVYITDFTVQNLLDLYGGHIEELHINGQALMSAIYDRKNILVHYEGDTVGGYDILLGEVSGSEMYFSVYSHFGFVFFCEAVEDIITSIHFGDLTGEKVERTQTGDLTHIAVANALQTADGYTYAVPDSATGDEDDVLLSRSTVKTINGESIVGSGDITISGGSGEDIRYFTEFTVEQILAASGSLKIDNSELLVAVQNNKLICIPYQDGENGFIVASYEVTLDEDLYVSFIYGTVYYRMLVIPVILSISIQPLSTETVFVDSGYIDVYDNTNYVVTTPVTRVVIQPMSRLNVGSTIRFTTGEDCSISISDTAKWVNGVIPTIESGVTYELSIVYQQVAGVTAALAVLTPFKSV